MIIAVLLNSQMQLTKIFSSNYVKSNTFYGEFSVLLLYKSETYTNKKNLFSYSNTNAFHSHTQILF